MKRPEKAKYVQSIHRPLSSDRVSILGMSDRIKKKLVRVPTKENPMYVSPSEIASFLRCRLQWHWRYQMGLERNMDGKYRGIGLIFHESIEHWYALPWKKRNAKRMRKIVERVVSATTLNNLEQKERELVIAMTIGYAEWARDGDSKFNDEQIGLRKALPELKFDLPLTPHGDIRVRGKIDLPFEHYKKDIIGMAEFKTKDSISFDHFEISPQVSTYLWALGELFPGHRSYRSYPTIARRQMPGPRVKAALFGRDEITRSDEELLVWAEDTRRVALDMIDAAIYPNKTQNCKFDCDFKDPCLLRGDKADVKDCLKNHFHKYGEQVVQIKVKERR